MWHVELKIPLNGCFAAGARAATCSLWFHMARRPQLGQVNESGCVFKTTAVT
jgi:hypothetical protein